MELRQLTYFDAIVRFGGFSRAASRLHVAQPAVSTQIRRLESELGVRLLRRTTRRVSLTEAGELFAARVARVLAELTEAREELRAVAELQGGTVRVGATPVLGGLDLAGALAGFRRRYPAVALELRSGLLGELLGALDAGALELVVGPVHAGLSERYAVRRLAEESLVLVLPPDRAAAGRRATPLAEVAGEPFVCLPAGSGLRDIVVRAAGRAGFAPRVDFEADTPARVRDLVSAGLGVALLAESVVRGPGAPVVVRALEDPPEHPPIGVIAPAGPPTPPAAGALVAHLAEAAVAAGVSRPSRG